MNLRGKSSAELQNFWRRKFWRRVPSSERLISDDRHYLIDLQLARLFSKMLE